MNLTPVILPFVVGLAPAPQTDVPSRFVGTWTLTSTQEERSVARRAGLPPETIVVRLNGDGTFRYTVTTGSRTRSTAGSFETTGNDLLLYADRPFPGVGGRRLKGHLWDEGLELLGTSFEVERERVYEPPVAQPDPEFRVPRYEPPAPAYEPPVRRYLRSVAGSWTLRSNGREDRSNRFRFTNDGRWEFKGGNASSAGRYTLEDGVLTLYYETVDGDPVNRSMKRVFVTSSEDEFVIDRYHYQRQNP